MMDEEKKKTALIALSDTNNNLLENLKKRWRGNKSMLANMALDKYYEKELGEEKYKQYTQSR